MKLSRTIFITTLVVASTAANEDLGSSYSNNNGKDNNGNLDDGAASLRGLKGGKDGGKKGVAGAKQKKAGAAKKQKGGGDAAKKQKGGDAKKQKGGKKVSNFADAPNSVANYGEKCSGNIPPFQIPVKPAKLGSQELNRQMSSAVNRFNRMGYEISREVYERSMCTDSSECEGCCCLGSMVLGYVKPGLGLPTNLAEGQRPGTFGEPMQVCVDVTPFTTGLTTACVKKPLGGINGGIGGIGGIGPIGGPPANALPGVVGGPVIPAGVVGGGLRG